MYSNPFQISLETLLGASAILGHSLEDRAVIREAQDRQILRSVQQLSAVPLSNFDQQHLFAVAPLDILVEQVHGRKMFHIIEMNGTGIGGLTNLNGEAVGAILEDFASFAEMLPERNPLILIASSGLESDKSPRKNKLIHEKILYAEALRRGFAGKGQAAVVTTMNQLAAEPNNLDNGRPTIVLGYIKEFLRSLAVDHEGQLLLFGRAVTVAVNDRFCLNLCQLFQDRLDLSQLQMLNGSFLAGGDKGIAYELLNNFLDHRPLPLARRVKFEYAETRQDLIETVLDWVRQGKRTVIKPQGTGLGHGIEFFLNPRESDSSIMARIDGSLRFTEEYYGLPGGALPYTICEFIDSCTIERPGHTLHGRKYELRVVVYRDGLMLRAFPSIAKVAHEVYRPDRQSLPSLINNITASATTTRTSGAEHMLPLSNPKTLELLGLSLDELRKVSALATNYVRFVLDQLQTSPARFGLPEETMSLASAMP